MYLYGGHLFQAFWTKKIQPGRQEGPKTAKMGVFWYLQKYPILAVFGRRMEKRYPLDPVFPDLNVIKMSKYCHWAWLCTIGKWIQNRQTKSFSRKYCSCPSYDVDGTYRSVFVCLTNVIDLREEWQRFHPIWLGTGRFTPFFSSICKAHAIFIASLKFQNNTKFSGTNHFAFFALFTPPGW